MRDEHLAHAPSVVALACAVGGLVVIGGTTWFAGGQHTVFTQLQFVLVAFGAGVGAVVVAGVLHLAARRRQGERRVEEAVARMLLAAADLPEPAPRPTVLMGRDPPRRPVSPATAAAMGRTRRPSP